MYSGAPRRNGVREAHIVMAAEYISDVMMLRAESKCPEGNLERP